MSNTKMMLIGLLMLAGVVLGLVMAGISNSKNGGRVTEADYSAKAESDSVFPVEAVSAPVKIDSDQEKGTVVLPRDGYNSYRVNDKKLENFSIEWIHGNLRRQGYRVSTILVHGMRSRGSEYSVNGMAEIKNSLKQRMRTNWVIDVQADHNNGYIVIKADLTDPFLVTR